MTYNMLYILKTGKGHSKETKEQDTVDRGQKKNEENKAHEKRKGERQEMERLHKHL